MQRVGLAVDDAPVADVHVERPVGDGELVVEGLDGCDGTTSCVVEYLTGSDSGRAGGEGEGGGTAALGAGTIGIGFVSCVRNNDEMGSMGTRGGID